MIYPGSLGSSAEQQRECAARSSSCTLQRGMFKDTSHHFEIRAENEDLGSDLIISTLALLHHLNLATQRNRCRHFLFFFKFSLKSFLFFLF